MRALNSAASGMGAQQVRLDNIAHNLANVNTTGFKKSRESFQDLYYEKVQAGGPTSAQGTANTSGVAVGNGVRTVAIERVFTQGTMVVDNQPLHLTIDGPGFFQVSRPDGSLAYTRDGSFQRDAEGRITTQQGFPLLPEMTVPEGTRDLAIGQDGSVNAYTDGQEEPQSLGMIQLATFINPAGLDALGGNLYAATDRSGDAALGNPGEAGFGRVQQGGIEGSNVDVAEELVNMIRAQRSYELSSKVVQAADEMMGYANSIRR
ncbi:flagellar basal-body rod protein FlgG [Myxococcota bacterium]|nr:flagellar basal-body rod protein FlgG [Myxococcota bacterium]